MSFREDEIEITFFKSRGPGGQKKNVTESAVRVRHLPTGIVVVGTASRSQHRNKEIALEELARRLERLRRRRTPRLSTRPTKASRTRRLEDKRRRGARKTLRRDVADD